MNLTIIVPLYNETDLICVTLDRLMSVSLPAFINTWEVVVVDDFSSDGSYERVIDYARSYDAVRVLRHDRNMGKGAAIRTGARAAKGDVLLIQDADMELDPADIPTILNLMHDNNLAMAGGSRFLSKEVSGNHFRLSDLANKAFSLLASAISGRRITDLTCGYKAIRKNLFTEIQPGENRFGFETEMAMKYLRKKTSSYGEAPVTYNPRNRKEGKKIRLHDGISILLKILRYGLPGRRWISALTVIVSLIIVFSTIMTARRWKNENLVIEWDVISYYAYLPSVFIYHDPGLTFIEDYKGPHKFIFWPEKNINGKYVIKTTMGLSLLYLPFFVLGHAAALITGADAGGFSPPYKVALLMSAVFFLALGLYYLRKTLLEYFSDIITALVITGFVFGTNLLFYSTYQATMSHVYSFALISGFLWYTIEWHRNPSVKNSVISGLLIGLISLVRPSNVIIVLAFILFNVMNSRSLKERFDYFLKNHRMLLLIAATAFLVWVPQFVYWKFITGHFLYYSYTANEGFFFNHPQIINGLFSFRKGLFIYTPVTIFSFAGIWHLWRNRSPFALPVSVFIPLNLYIIFSWWCWWYAGSFGMRPVIDSFALMALPVASLLHSLIYNRKKLVKIPVIIVYVLTVSLGLYYHKQYYYGAIHWDSMTKEAFFDSFGRLRPSDKFKSLLASPDYDKAKLGIQATIPEEENAGN